MRYIVYTDGSGSNEKNVAGCSCLILTETSYVNSESVSIKGVSNPTHAETISVGLAAAYFIDNVDLKPDDTIEFNIDCVSTIEFYNRWAKTNKKVRSNVVPIINSVFIVRKLTQKCNVVFQKVKGHKSSINPNTYVDRLAKLAIRR